MDFSIIKKAGLTQTEFGKLCGVDRVTVNLWTKGRTKPHRLHRDAVDKRLKLVETAIELGHLPLQASYKPEERLTAIHGALEKTIRRPQEEATV